MGERCHRFAVAVGGLAGFLIEVDHFAEAIGHFRHRNDRLAADREVDSGVGCGIAADRVEPVFVVTFIGDTGEFFAVNLVGEWALRTQFDLFSSEIKGRVVAADNFPNSFFVDRASHDMDVEAIRKLDHELRRIWHVAVGGDFSGSHGRDAYRIVGGIGGDHQRVEFVGKEIAEDSGAVGVVFAPAEVGIGIERTIRDLAEPAFPIHGVGGGGGIDAVVPFPCRAVAGEGGLSQHERSDFSVADKLA